MHAHEDRLVVSVCVGSHGRESLGMNSSMQAMAGRCGAWGWTCALSATVGVVACISLPCNPINSNTIPENAAPLAAPKTHPLSLFVCSCLPPIVLCSPALAAVRRLTSGIRAVRRDLRRNDIAAAPWPDAAAEQGRHVGGQQDPVTLAERQDAAAHALLKPFSTAPISTAPIAHARRTSLAHPGCTPSAGSRCRAHHPRGWELRQLAAIDNDELP